MLADKEGHAAPIGWTSNKVKRVVNSTIAAEALSPDGNLPRCLPTNNPGRDPRSGCTLHTYLQFRGLQQPSAGHQLDYTCRLRVDIALIQQSMVKHKVSVKWIGAPDMITDCLTKRTAKSDTLMDVVTTGPLPKEVLRCSVG